MVDHKRGLYSFESAISPNLFWVDLNKIDFNSSAQNIKKLDLGPNQSTVYAGEVSAQFKTHKPFTFIAAE